MQSSIAIVSYQKSPLQTIMPFFELQPDINVFDEKSMVSETPKFKEIWIDAYIDLYDSCLFEPEYLYYFFLRIHQIINKFHKTSSIIRIFQNFSYQSNHTELNKVFALYHMFTQFFDTFDNVFPIILPDILNTSYKNHPCTELLNHYFDQLVWEKKSLFRIIHPNDIVYNLLENQIPKSPVVLGGIKVSMLDIYQTVEKILGIVPDKFEYSYMIDICDDLPYHNFSNIHYNLETILISYLS
ncbi:MAG: hypothetical protein ACRCTQ_01455 [Brevinemataceae bacterium]